MRCRRRWLQLRVSLWSVIPDGVKETPHEIALSLILSMYGLLFLLFGAAVTPNTIDDALPYWLVFAWAACFAAGGPLTLLGRFRYALRLESSGLALQAAGLLIYGTVLAQVGWSSLVSVAVVWSLAGGNGVRMWVIRHALYGPRELHR
jgi:hypothetical protein